MDSMIQVTLETQTGAKVGKMTLPSGAVPQVGDRVTYFDNDGIIRQRDVVRGRHFVQSIHTPGIAVKLLVMSESEIMAEASQAEAH